MILYGPGGFNPTSGCANAIVANDDADGSTFLSKIVTSSPLAAGTYTLVVTTFFNEPQTGSPPEAPLPYGFTGFSSVPFIPVKVQHIVDFDGDGKTDYSVIRNLGTDETGQAEWWNATNATGAVSVVDWGLAGDSFTPVDFDGDHKTDIAVWRGGAAGNSFFYILQSMTNTVRIVNFGQDGDNASVVGDYDGDGKADPAVYRPGPQSTWFYLGSLNNPNNNITYVPWGVDSDFPAPGDYDGDGKNDFCIQRDDGNGNGIFWLATAAGTPPSVTWFGLPGDLIVPGDYDGDGKTDFATVRGIVNGSTFNWQWYWMSSSTGQVNSRVFGLAPDDLQVQGDYDGDGLTDVAIWRPGPPSFFSVLRSSDNMVVTYRWGLPDDVPAAGYNTH
jgi:hypothetical protein